MNTVEIVQGVQIYEKEDERWQEILTPEAASFVARLHREFRAARKGILQKRQERQERINRGELPDFLHGTSPIRESEWQVAPAPHDLQDRRVEITGPAEPKMMINALCSGARVFMADLEDAMSPTWSNVLLAQQSLIRAVRKSLSFRSPEGKLYRLEDPLATLVVRPRGWHLEEKHVLIDGEPVSASLLDFGLYFFHNAEELIALGSGPYFYLPKLESHLEARLWNDVFVFAQGALRIPRGTIRATVLIETILAAFEMEEILYELREHAAGLNAGRWDYIFSAIKKFSGRADFRLPDRSKVTMTVPFMRAYTELLVKTCHKRGAHAIGGMAAFIPSRRDPEINEMAMAKVREDKERESRDGFDGTWVAHPDLVPLAKQIFDAVLKDAPNQKSRLRKEVKTTAAELLSISATPGEVTETGVRGNIDVALQYVERWLSGLGAVAIHNLMEDAATAEIARAQLWQWIRHGVRMDDGRAVTSELYQKIRDEELAKLGGPNTGRFADAVKVLDQLVLNNSFRDFLTLEAYGYLN